MGATDVCPLVPIANIEMDEVVTYAHKLGELVGKELVCIRKVCHVKSYVSGHGHEGPQS